VAVNEPDSFFIVRGKDRDAVHYVAIVGSEVGAVPCHFTPVPGLTLAAASRATKATR
jgi:hypothetical protein